MEIKASWQSRISVNRLLKDEKRPKRAFFRGLLRPKKAAKGPSLGLKKSW
jgi:hypothetical protein